MTNAFEIIIEGWQQLRDLLAELGFKKVEVPLFNVEAKALILKTEPATLKFYQNYGPFV